MQSDRRVEDAVACEICGSTASWSFDKASCPHYRCRECLHLFVWPKPSQAQLESVYEDEHYYDRGASEAERIRSDAESRLQMLEKLAAEHKLERGLLDVGCATGLFLGVARARGWDAAGLERSSRMAGEAREATGAVVHSGILEGRTIVGGPFPVVTAWEVLEHVIDPSLWLEDIVRNVAPGGLLALSTPRSDGLPARLMGRKFPMISPPEHLSLFSRRSLRLLAARHGLEEVQYLSFSNLSAEGLASGFARMACNRELSEVHPALSLIFEGVGAITAWIPEIVDWAGYGTEMLVIFRKTKS